MARSLIGPKIRDRRQALGITQAGLASSGRHLGVVPEPDREQQAQHRRRACSSASATSSGSRVEELDGAAERRLIGDLVEMAGEPLLAPLAARWRVGRATSRAGIRDGRTRWSRCTARGAIATRRSARCPTGCRQDPFLGDAVHSMLTRVAAIRSSSEILATIDDLRTGRAAPLRGDHRRPKATGSPTWRRRWRHSSTRRSTGTRSITPVEEVDDFLLDRDNHFPALEQAAEDFRAARARSRGECHEQALVDYLQREHSVGVREQRRAIAGATASDARRVRRRRAHAARSADTVAAGHAALRARAARRRAVPSGSAGGGGDRRIAAADDRGGAASRAPRAVIVRRGRRAAALRRVSRGRRRSRATTSTISAGASARASSRSAIGW